MTQSLEHRHPSAPPASVATLALLGGWLCLDFVNTVDPRRGEQPHDYLSSYTDLVEWSHHAGQLSAPERERLIRTAAPHAQQARRALAQAIALREALYRIFAALARASDPPAADLEVLRGTFAEALRHATLIPMSAGFAWTWPAQNLTLDGLVWPIAASAIALLTSDHIRRVKKCAGEGGCGWLFLDSSKNGSRRWCSMDGCGSRAKMRRQYARKRLSRQAGTPDSFREAEDALAWSPTREDDPAD